jgi:hypothetical protein
MIRAPLEAGNAQRRPGMDDCEANSCGNLMVSILLAAVSRRVSGSNRKARHHATARNSSPLTETGLVKSRSDHGREFASRFSNQDPHADFSGLSLRSLPRLRNLLIFSMHTPHAWGYMIRTLYQFHQH